MKPNLKKTLTFLLLFLMACSLKVEEIKMEKTPIILIHGHRSDSSAWYAFKIWFEEDGFDVYTPNLEPADGNITFLASQLNEYIKNNSLDKKNISIIAHSMGGIVAREYIKDFKPNNIKRIVMLGTPNKGSSLSWFFGVNTTAAKQMQRYSEFMNELENEKLDVPCLNIIGTKYLLYGIEYDGVILKEEAELEECNSTYVNYNHLELTTSREVYKLIKNFISQ